MSGYRLAELELSAPLQPIALQDGEQGLGLIAKWHGRPVGLHLEERHGGTTIAISELQTIVDRHFAAGLLAARVEDSLPEGDLPGVFPDLTIAICTRNRAARLTRLLRSIQSLTAEPHNKVAEVLVVDNGSTDETRAAVAAFAAVRYVHEARPGLNFARNAALREARGELIAFLDDDVLVEGGWLKGLEAAWRSRPDAGGFTGLVLPMRLDTTAQVLFEARGGFRRGFRRIEFRDGSYDNPLFPVGAGSVGAGCNMAFDRQLLIGLGGFDEALDTGPPLPGGGDLDIFYRVLRSGRPMIYEPRYCVQHEHRNTLRELESQYRSWGLGLMAFLSKSSRTDPALRRRHRAMICWWFADQLRSLARSIMKYDFRLVRFQWAELGGGVLGLFGGYRRSRKRVAAIRNQWT